MTFKLEENEKLIKQASVSLYRAAKLNRDGQLHLTNRRICFAGQGGDSFCYPLDAIISVTFTNVGLIFAQGFTIAFDDQRREHIGAVYNREDWVEKILEAKNEFDPLGHAVPDQDSSFFERFRVELRKKIATHFSDDEIKTLCFDLNVDYEALKGDTKSTRARELILDRERKEQLPELVRAIHRLRPDLRPALLDIVPEQLLQYKAPGDFLSTLRDQRIALQLTTRIQGLETTVKSLVIQADSLTQNLLDIILQKKGE